MTETERERETERQRERERERKLVSHSAVWYSTARYSTVGEYLL